jgi:transcriptional regulator with XRE-family HTH domain
MSFSQNVKYLLAKRGLKRADLARMMDRDQSRVSKDINGPYAPKFDTLVLYGKALDVNIQDLMMEDLAEVEPRPFDYQAFETSEGTDEQLKRINELLEQRVKMLEREILRNDPDLAKDLGIE